MIFYTAERDYGEKIDDANIRKLFYDIYDTCDEAGYLKHSAPNGWLPASTILATIMTISR